jgi:hypothetical protein
MRFMRHTRILVLATALVACPTINPISSGAPSTNLSGCTVFPANNVWNAPVNKLPLDARSSAYVSSIGAGTGLHPDFGAGLYQGSPIGIPFVVVPASQPGVKVSFEYADESDQLPYPVPRDAPIEGGVNASGDRHVLVVQQGSCKLYELFGAYPNPDGTWKAGSGATWVLTSNALRPDTWTSADAAGLPILPGLVRYDEVLAGKITHAIRFTAPRTRNAYVWPARHAASSSTDANLPTMGQRFRLRANFDTTSFSRDTRVILEAMKTYGVILADNGSSWYISGTPDDRWDNDALSREFGRVKGSDFEAVDASGLKVSADSGAVK